MKKIVKSSHTSLKNQIHLYSLDTGCFYTPSEQQLHNRMLRFIRYKDLLKETDTENWNTEKREKRKKLLSYINQKIKEYKQRLMDEFPLSVNTCRTLSTDKLTDNRIISVFESTLTRTCQMFPDSA